MRKIWVKLLVISLLTSGIVIPTATTTSANAAVATRPNAISGIYTAYSFANAITGVTGNGSAVTFTFTTQTGTGSNWSVGDYITVTFPSSDATTTAYNLGQVAITAITSNTITVASTVKVDTAKYPNTVALTGLTSSSTGIRAGTLTVTRDPNGASTPNGCSLGGTMTIADGSYDVPKYVSLGQAINNGTTVKIADGIESVDQGIYGNAYQVTKSLNGTEITTLSNCKGTMYIPEGVKSLSSAGGQTGVTNIAFSSTMEVIQGNALSGYTGLVSLNLDPVKYLMTGAFSSGCNISSLSLGSTFEFFGKQALQGCSNLTAVALPPSIRSLGEWTFGGSAVTYFDLPASFTCTEPGLRQESGCDWKIGQYFFGGQSGSTTLAPAITINLANIASASTKTALQHYLGVQTLRGTVTSTNDTNCTGVTANNKCNTTTFVPNPSGNLLADGFGRTGMGYNVGNFPSVVFTENAAEGAEQTFTQSVTSEVTTQLSAVSNMSFSKSNNSFAGWNTAANGSGTTYVDLDSISITSTLYLYAQWSPIYIYTVNLNPGTSGTGTQMAAMTGTAATVKLNANTYSRTGYTFNGWNTAENGTGTSYINQGTVRLTVDNQTVTLYAQWLAITYTITYLPGPNGSSTSSAQTLSYGGSVTLKDASAGFTRTGYSIVGWTTSSVSGAAKTNDLSSAYSSLAPITLYPVWDVGVYAITYDGQGATTAASGGSTTYTAASAIAAIPTTAPLRTGYSFRGWFTASTGGTQVTAGSYTPSSPYGAITIYAQWTAITSNAITFDGQGATTAASGGSTTYTTASAIAAIPTTAPLRTGYSFRGWFTASTGGTQVTAGSYTPSSPYGAITIYAQWTANTFNASFDSQGGSAVSAISFSTGSILTLPAAPTRAGYTFNGWFAAATGGTAFATGYSPANTSAFTLYAQWTANTNVVTYNSQGGSAASNGSFVTGSALTLPAASTRAGYTFNGWFAAATGGTALVSGYSPTNTSGFTVYAQWTANTNVVTYDSQGGSAVSNGSFVTGTTLTLPTSPTRTGYTFNGWFAAATGGTALVTGYSPTNTSNFTIYAQWTGTANTVTYDSQGGSAVSNGSFSTGSALTLPATPTRAGYTFNGWFAAATGGTALVNGYSPTNTSGFTVYAQWTANTNVVTYDSQGGSAASNGSFVTGSTLTLPADPIRAGYTFNGWFAAATGGTALVTGYSPTNTSAFTLYARWTAITYTISYLANSATSGIAPSSQSFTTGGSPLTLASSAGLLKTGFFFAGWNTLADGSGTDYIDGATGQTFATDLTLYAKWTTSPTRTVTFKANGGVGSDTTQSTNVDTALISNTFTRPGYIFAGWNSAADGTGSDIANNANYAFTSNLVLFAKWTAKTSRTLSFASTAVDKKYGETLNANASLSLGTGTITYSRGSSTACSINVNTGLITITNSTGTCVITAASTEDATYQAVESTVSLVVTVSLGLPAVPTLGTITSVDGVLKVAFTQSDAAGNAITDYKYSIDGINFISIGKTTSPLSIPGLTPGTYTLRIIAVNAFGESSPTAPVIVIVIAGPTVTVTAPATGGGIVYVPTGPSAAEIAADQRAAVEKALAEKAAADKVIADKLAAEKAAADKLAAEKAAADKVIADKLAAEKAAADKIIADKLAEEKAAADKALADKLAAEKAAADKAIADKLAADNSAAAALYKSTCNLAQGSTVVTPKSSTMKIYSQVCFVPDSMKPIDSDLVQVKKLIKQLKSKKIRSVTLSSFADEKNGVNFKSVAQSRADAVASMIKKANPKIKITYRLYGSSTKKNSLSLGRVVITA